MKQVCQVCKRTKFVPRDWGVKMGVVPNKSNSALIDKSKWKTKKKKTKGEQLDLISLFV